MLPTCGCLLKRTCRGLEKKFCSEFRHSLTKSSHAAIPHVHFYEVILGEVWKATCNRTSRSFVEVARILGFYAPTGPWSHCGKLWRLVDLEGVLCVSSDRRHSRPEDQAPDLLQMTEKRCAMAMAYLLWHLIIASVRRTRSLHTVRQVCTFHWLPCVSLLTASAHAKSIK